MSLQQSMDKNKECMYLWSTSILFLGLHAIILDHTKSNPHNEHRFSGPRPVNKNSDQ
jgi:hypothetical protein